ncbi:PEP-CTERM sorting domain-containing protein [Dasania sp. GY-MA-18]|uniref:PEP-CTERM sorting domain-containing protein n=1 Tax=Dasania phycosphaerae TaxID=2950436 RepID=A0A9J6RRK6_9GAMM|nr:MULTISPECIES: PEP-CTERM sorting domain-containing protein [Dasania]MCR8924260.1 PEP-CTERM sorting domain-containing protein [Dasania sp. GY-MA-18]MCZ0866913.1 PEP-CTERM sorting domain-containing protein [Dasania phycosphaerae]MCZ0870417.1 PEP-CTERM sorting domain-containing protein [Dasania phycosphaerae]
MTIKNKLLRRTALATTFCATCLSSISASAHLQEFAWNENIDGTIDFFGSTYHGSQASALGSGLTINGTSFNYTSFTSIGDAAWTTFLNTQADGYQFIENFANVSGYGKFTLSLTNIASLGWVTGANPFTASVFSSGAEFVDINGNGTNYYNTLNYTAVAEPASLGLMGLGIAALGFIRRKKNS